ncbi:uncharacterized protein LY79DRAFT_88806 [Colletotrichum navitas]|uniref:Uncharacterized protein n=1 Tax=Colletotrichum navitas TaxID=681940 RepID=A0AAD8Q5P6_9PEZI|nr:uncharacterized protein LY79DRAFT_88806 [Colletotrichum navitas]KAK1595706.1 hypothetical protein LY79DRAFT_88806 [Colletotrichum navitas]
MYARARARRLVQVQVQVQRMSYVLMWHSCWPSLLLLRVGEEEGEGEKEAVSVYQSSEYKKLSSYPDPLTQEQALVSSQSPPPPLFPTDVRYISLQLAHFFVSGTLSLSQRRARSCVGPLLHKSQLYWAALFPGCHQRVLLSTCSRLHRCHHFVSFPGPDCTPTHTLLNCPLLNPATSSSLSMFHESPASFHSLIC